MKKYILPNNIPEDFQIFLKNINILGSVEEKLNLQFKHLDE
jgi:hypothetical protein